MSKIIKNAPWNKIAAPNPFNTGFGRVIRMNPLTN